MTITFLTTRGRRQLKFERIKLSNRSQQLLGSMKKKTGLTPNILARFALCMSIKERSIPNPDEFDQGGSELSRDRKSVV